MCEELPTGSPHAILAAYLESHRAQVLADYERRLEETSSPLTRDRSALGQVLAHADETIDEVIESLLSGREVSAEGSRLLPRHIGVARASAGTHPAEMIRSAAELFKILTATTVDCAAVESGAPLAFAVLALNQSMSLRIREAISSYYGVLLDKLHQAHTDERRHLARDLHDRVSASVNIAFRQLELYEMTQGKDPAAANQRVESAQHALVQAMYDIRQLTSELRLTDPFQGLEKNLRNYLEATGATDVAAKVIVNGDESWVAPDARNEVFLIVREAVRNALHHGDARAVLIRIDIAPHELHATVDDDGVGFDPAAVAVAPGGTGIPSMRERVALLGGTIRLSSEVGKGAKVEIHIPLAAARGSAG